MEFISQSEFSRRVGRSAMWISKLVKAGKLPVNEKGKIPWEEGKEAFMKMDNPAFEANRERWKKHREEKGKAPTFKLIEGEKPETRTLPEDDDDKLAGDFSTLARGEALSMAKINEQFNKARLAEKTYQAKLKEIEYKEAKGLLVPVQDIHQDARRAAEEIRSKLMSIPPKVAAASEGMTAKQIEWEIEKAINEVLEILHGTRFGNE